MENQEVYEIQIPFQSKDILHVQRKNEPYALNCQTLAEVIPLSVNQIRYYVRQGLIPFKKVGKHYFFPVKMITDWLNNGGLDKINEAPVKASKRVHKMK